MASSRVGLKHGGESPHGGFFQMKEFSLISHIEALKCAANGEPSNECRSNSSTATILPALGLLNISYNNDAPGVQTIKERSLSKNWDIDPASVSGNLRNDAKSCHSNLTVEEILSRGSSVSGVAIQQEYGEYPDASTKNAAKAKKKLIKASKKKVGSKKSSRGTVSPNNQNNGAVISPVHIFSKLAKNARSPTHTAGHSSINALTALCQSVTIHEKTASSINVKTLPYSKKSSVTNTQNSHHKQTPARTSLNNALVEYSKKSNSQPTTVDRRRSFNGEEESMKLTKIFLSEKQSGIISDGGVNIPCAPPATPTAEQLKRYEYVPSLQDIRSQRSFRQRLQLMESRALRKEKRKQDDNTRIEMLSLREKRIEMKRQQRLQIYALNKVMTDLENERFQHFMANVGPNI